MADSPTSALAAFAASAEPPDEVRAVMRLSLLDWAAVGLAGTQEPASRIVRDLALADGGTLEATVLGATRRLPARAAALVNGTTSHALDYDDTHFAHIGHPSVVVVPAALAVAERAGADGEAFLDACLIGVEASIRVGVWLGRAHYQAGFHQTGTAGAFGAALAAGRFLGLTPEDMVQALGIVSTRASGLKSQFGTMGKPLNAGIAAQNGVEAALLASRGLVSCVDGLEGAQGFGATHAGATDPIAFDRLGRDWLSDGISHKFHACCHGTHAALEALADLKGRFEPASVAEVVVATHPRWLGVCNIAVPKTGLEAKFSYRVVAAMSLAGWDTRALRSFSDRACGDAVLVGLRDRVRVEADDGLADTAAQVSVRLHDGSLHEASHDLDAPMELHERQERILAKVTALLGDGKARELWRVIGAGPSVEAFAAHLGGET